MSDSAYIDSSKGPHAAAGLTDEQVEYLCQMILWEVSIRTSKEQYVGYLERLIELRETHGDIVDEAQRERDLMRFEEEVLADLAHLPVRAGTGEAAA